MPVSILAAGVLIAGALIYNTGAKRLAVDDGAGGGQLTANVGAVLDGAVKDRVVLGDVKAPVALVEFADFQCPFCGKFHLESGERLRKEYIETGKVKMTLVDLAFLGPESVQAAQAAHCAGDQKKYWGYHDKLYGFLWDNYYAKGKNGENVGAFSDDNLKKFAVELGLKAGEFNQCLDSKKYAATVEDGYKAAQAVLGDRLSTPSVFINGKLVQGAQPYDVFKAAIEEALK